MSSVANQEVKQKILNLDFPERGLSIKQIASRIDYSPATAGKYVHILEGEGKVKIEELGNLKLVKKKNEG